MKTLQPLKTCVVLACSVALFVGCQNEKTGDKTMGDKPDAESADSGDSEPLSKQLSMMTEERMAKAPEAMKVAFKKGIESVKGTGIEKSAMQVGDNAIDAELTGWDGETVKLSELWSEKPVVLMWYRGGWCPYCSLQLRAMQQNLDQIKGAGATLVVLTPELPEKAKATAETNDLDMVALHDKDSALADQYGIMYELPESIAGIYRDKLKLPEYNGSDKLQLPLSATYVVDIDGTITYAFLDADYKKRAEPSEVIEAVEMISQKK